MQQRRRKCYVIMPFSASPTCTEQEWTDVFELVIKPAVTSSRLLYDVERSKIRTGAFISDILNSLVLADEGAEEHLNRELQTGE